MLRIVPSSKSLEQLGADLETAVSRHQFGVMAVHDLRAKMAEKGVEFPRECRIYEVCNPRQAQRVLERNMAIATALPCRIAVYEDGGRRVLATLRPTAMVDLFAGPGLGDVAQEVEATLERIMAEAAGEPAYATAPPSTV